MASRANHRSRPENRLLIGTRKSRLARWQTDLVIRKLREVNPDLGIEIKEFSTQGDRQIDRPLPEIGGKGLFTEDLDRAINEGKIDIAIHSLKDLPTEMSPGICTLPVLSREDPRDILISKSGQTFSELAPGSVIGTSSNRRRAQLSAMRPDIQLRSVRGNVPTRVAKVETDQYDGVILAAAGIIRLELTDKISDWFPLMHVLPAPGQAALAASFRCDDEASRGWLRPLCDHATTIAVTAERAYLSAMGGGCSSPIAAFARQSDSNPASLILIGRVSALDGSEVITMKVSGSDPQALGAELASQVLDAGGQRIMDSYDGH